MTLLPKPNTYCGNRRCRDYLVKPGIGRDVRSGRYVCDSCWFAISRTFSYTVTGSTILLGIGYAVAKWLWP